MRDFSKVSPTLWRSRKFRSLPNRDCRHVYTYLLTCPHGNSSGCFDLHPMYACADLDMVEIEYRNCIESLCAAGLIEFDQAENTVFMANWLEFNAPSNQKHTLGLLSQLEQASSKSLKAKRFHELYAEITSRKFDREASVRNALHTLCEQYGNGIPTETRDRDQTETETRPDQTETETREKSSRTPLRAVAAEGRDGLAAQREEPQRSGASRAQGPPSSELLQSPLVRSTA